MRSNKTTFVFGLAAAAVLSAVGTAGATGNDIVAYGQEKGPLVRVYKHSNGELLAEFPPFGAAFKGGIRVAVGDVDGDGEDDLICATGKGFGAVNVFDGGQLLLGSVLQIGGVTPYGPAFTGGLFVAAGDFNGDSKADIVVGPDSGPPTVHIIDGATLSSTPIYSFSAYTADHTSGVRVAVGNVNSSGKVDIVTAPGKKFSPLIRVFDGDDTTGDPTLLHEFLAYDALFTGGVYVAVGDVVGGGAADIITGPGAGLSPDVRIFDGDEVTNGGGVPIAAQFNAFESSNVGGVVVGYSGAADAVMFSLFKKTAGFAGFNRSSFPESGEDGTGEDLFFVHVFAVWKKGVYVGG